MVHGQSCQKPMWANEQSVTELLSSKNEEDKISVTELKISLFGEYGVKENKVWIMQYIAP